jgi:hypothetical protein
MQSLSLTFVAFTVLEATVAFHVLPRSIRVPFPISTTSVLVHKDVGVGKDLVASAGNPFRDVDLDLERIQDCANHFGKYPVAEIEKMRDGKPSLRGGS